MAQQTAQSASALRAVVFRISSTPSKQLPNVAPQIAGSIWNCRDLLSVPAENHKKDSDVSNLLTRFKTHLSTLLQDRTVEGRWAAIVLVKATIEAGGLELLRNSNAWVRGLLGILKKPDPPTTRNMATITLTRIFMLTWDYSDLIRTITTPALTTFVATCLVNIENRRCSARELQTVLEAFATLLPRHPTIFRTNEIKVRAILSKILSGSASSEIAEFHHTEAHKTAADRLWVSLHHCTPKQGASDKWKETLNATVEAAHSTCDRIFRCVQEDWQSVAGIQPSRQQLAGGVELDQDDLAGLKPWKGIYAGAERLQELLRLLNAHLVSPTSNTVSVQIGLVLDLLTRVFGVAVPQSGKPDFIKFNNQISRDEREALLSVLPQIHVAAIEVSIVLLNRLGTSATPSIQATLDQASYIFRAERDNAGLRLVIYQLLAKILDVSGPSLSKNEILELTPVLRASCQELLLDDEGSGPSKSGSQPSAGGIKQQLGLSGGQAQQTHPPDNSALIEASQLLLCTALHKLDSVLVPAKLRAQIDRVAILTRNEPLLCASIMNPPKKQNEARAQSSLMPILAREFGDGSEAEAIMRPRMPPIRPIGKTSGQVNGYGEDVEDLDEDEEDDEEMDGVEEEDEPLIERSHGLQGEFAAHRNVAAELDSPNSVGATATHDGVSKRRAEAELSDEISAKRLRSSPVAASLISDDTQMLSGPATVVAMDPSSSYQTAASQQTAVFPSHDADSDVDDSDGSEFEMPTLTADPDTDLENEDA